MGLDRSPVCVSDNYAGYQRKVTKVGEVLVGLRLIDVGAILDTLLFGACDGLFDPTRRVFTGGAPVSERTASSFFKVAGTRPRPLFGTTETGGIAVAGPLDDGGVRGRVGLAGLPDPDGLGVAEFPDPHAG